jgi:hypothetical protein
MQLQAKIHIQWLCIFFVFCHGVKKLSAQKCKEQVIIITIIILI